MVDVNIEPRFRIPKHLLKPAYSIQTVAMLYNIPGRVVRQMYHYKINGIECVKNENGEKLIPAKYIYKKDGESIDTKDFELILSMVFDSKSLFVDFISCYRYRFGKDEPFTYENLKKLTIDDLLKCSPHGCKKIAEIMTTLISVIQNYDSDSYPGGMIFGIYG